MNSPGFVLPETNSGRIENIWGSGLAVPHVRDIYQTFSDWKTMRLTVE